MTGHGERFELLRRAGLARAVAELDEHFGIEGFVGPGARWLVVSESDFRVLLELASATSGAMAPPWPVLGIPIVTAPDWTCDEVAVAWLRLRVVVGRPFVRLVRALARLLS